jgi:hypothetical protein
MSIEGHSESMSAPILRQQCTGGSCRQGREKCLTPEACYVPIDDEPVSRVAIALGWFVVWFFTIAVACGGAAWAGMALLEWLEPHWPRLVSMVTP